MIGHLLRFSGTLAAIAVVALAAASYPTETMAVVLAIFVGCMLALLWWVMD